MSHTTLFLAPEKKKFLVGFGNITYLNSELYFACDLHKNETSKFNQTCELLNYWCNKYGRSHPVSQYRAFVSVLTNAKRVPEFLNLSPELLSLLGNPSCRRKCLVKSALR